MRGRRRLTRDVRIRRFAESKRNRSFNHVKLHRTGILLVNTRASLSARMHCAGQAQQLKLQSIDWHNACAVCCRSCRHCFCCCCFCCCCCCCALSSHSLRRHHKLQKVNSVRSSLNCTNNHRQK